MSVKNFVSTVLLTSALFLGSGAIANVHAQSISLDQVNQHILKLRGLKDGVFGLKAEQIDSNREFYLNSLRQSEDYAQSLTEYLIKDYEDGGVDAYTLNLVHEYLSYQIGLHSQIVKLPLSKENILLKSMQLVTIKKVNDLFFSNSGLRAIYKDQLNGGYQGLEAWRHLMDRLFIKSYINTLNEMTKEAYYPLEKVNLDVLSTENKAIVLSFKESPLYNEILKGRNWTNTLLNENFWANFSDNTAAALGKVTTGASAAFGAVAGNIAWREGYLRDDKVLLDTLKKTVKPFDLLMEKKAYKFTDLTIPGHWGHIGVYLGTKEQLQQLGLWEHSVLDPFRENIERGKTIFQVRRTGLVFDSLDDFMNLDEMAVIRVEGQVEKPKDELKLVFEYLADQLNKSYDFSFDAMTSKTITCTEIVAFSYGPIKWPMDYLLGRYTISPNNMAELTFFTGSPLKTIAYITGDKQGTHYRSEAEFGETLEYKSFGNIYKKESSLCKRRTYRHNRSSIRFKYECETIYNENVY